MALALVNFYIKENISEQKSYSVVLNYLVHIIVWITPVMYAATQIAEYGNKNRFPYIHELCLIIALTALAWISDAFVVYGIRYISDAFIFFTVLLNYVGRPKRLEKKCAYWSKKARQELNIVGRNYENYKITLEKYEQYYPKDYLITIPFNHEARKTIAIYLGCNPSEII